MVLNYFRLGVAIALRPIITIACVLIGSLACTAGLSKFYEVDPSDPIWVDPASLYIKHKEWVENKFPSQLRLSFFIAEGDNLLTRDGLLEVCASTVISMYICCIYTVLLKVCAHPVCIVAS